MAEIAEIRLIASDVLKKLQLATSEANLASACANIDVNTPASEMCQRMADNISNLKREAQLHG